MSEQEGKPAPDGQGDITRDGGSTVNSADAKVYPWIKNLAALVSVFAALGGIWVGIKGLQDKARADERAAEIALDTEHRTAEATLEDEQIKRDISHDQLSQHQQDLDSSILLHKMDLVRAEETGVLQRDETNRKELTSLVTDLFHGHGSAEGDLAALFAYVGRTPDSNEIIENGVLARLENPQSLGEIYLCFNLLEQIGPEALETSVAANRSARHRYDDLLRARFENRVRAAAAANPTMDPYPKSMAVTAETMLDKKYASATLWAGVSPVFLDKGASVHPEEEELLKNQELAAAVVLRSSESIKSLLNHLTMEQYQIDLSRTYLAISRWPTLLEHEIDFTGAYLEQAPLHGTDATSLSPFTPLTRKNLSSAITAVCSMGTCSFIGIQ